MNQIPTENRLKAYEYPRICSYCSMSREYEVVRELPAQVRTADKEVWELCKCPNCGARFTRHRWWDYTTDEDGHRELRAFSTGFLPIETYLEHQTIRGSDRHDCLDCAHSKYVFIDIKDYSGQPTAIASLRCVSLKVSCESRLPLPGQCPRWTRPKRGNRA